MSYDNPRDRLELFLKKIIDKSTAPTERRTRFELFLAGILDGSLVPNDPRDRLELYLKGVAESGGYTPPSGTIEIIQNGVYTVETKQYADVKVPAQIADTVTLSLTVYGDPVIGIAYHAIDADDPSMVTWTSRTVSSSEYSSIEIPLIKTVDVLWDSFYLFIPDSYEISGKNNCNYYRITTGEIDLPGINPDADVYTVTPTDSDVLMVISSVGG